MRQNGQFQHKKMKEVIPEKYEVSMDKRYTIHHIGCVRCPLSLSLSLSQPEEVHFKTGQDTIELKVPVEEDVDHKPAHA